ncbi:uncharacterized protein PHACADRAFT_246870 [Phanerochaete carnosa HHB-10118-sp]|uniref:DUF7702 domain-containing protein n=1 Tax=Phanerochaete carnosa (strain HHB-10118-sp) TaxID=650164 RepID=K5VCU0_PHACS|nr:uncharacterized protein PHACADRAFT_246870 [Phanerochaete carnosa HHB-10118-sp]EKM60756.1 hypothetical protein PHACADRAFT_246870 [Phanerochaete carnosa HHB-10118-sp]
MTHLDSRSIVSAIEIVVYIPLAALSVCLLVKYGFKREGWLYLLILSIIRIAGGITHIIAQEQANPSTTLETVVTILETSGVSPLLIATVGFLTTVKQNAFEDGHLLHKGLRLMGLLSSVALLLTIVGGVNIGSNTSSDDVSKINSGNNLRHIGVILFVVQFVLTVLVTFFIWSKISQIMKHRRTLLKAITLSLPFLGVRVLYTILSAYSPLGIPGVTSGSPSLAKFNSTRGDFGIWLIMSPIMEFIVIVIYVTVGLATPLQNDYFVGGKGESLEDATQLNSSAYAPNPSHGPSASSVSVAKPYTGGSAYAPRPGVTYGA